MPELVIAHVSPRLLRPDDIPALLRLKDAAAWNQTAEDFHRLLALEPEGCFGIDCEGTLAACASAVCYGTELAWIGMVLTLPEFRGHGFARRLMEHALDYSRRCGVRWTKLDATNMGAPLYQKLGFEPECAVERRLRQPGPFAAVAGAARGEPDLALDRRAFGADRGTLLSALAREGTVWISGDAFGMGRAGSRAAYFGPCVGRSAANVRRLLESFLSEHSHEAIYWDLLPENEAAAELAQELGFVPVRRLVRMARRESAGAVPVGGDSSLVFALAGFEYG